MNQFSYVVDANGLVINQLRGWLNKIEEYVELYYEGRIENTRSTEFGDCIVKVRYIIQRAISEPLLFRGVQDSQGRLQAGAIMIEDSGNIYQYEESCNYLYLDALTNSPWNILSLKQPETIKGAATSILEEMIRENRFPNYRGVIKTQSITRARRFYTEIGFAENPDGSGEMVLTEEAANRFLETQQLKRLRLD